MAINLPDFDHLVDLNTFDFTVFISDDADEQNVCKIVLAFALIYNDLKDIIWAIVHLNNVKLEKEKITPENGQYNGFMLHLIRLFYSLIHELLYLVEKKPKYN